MASSAAPASLVLGLGDPVMDVCVDVSPEFLASIGAQPGGCSLVEPRTMAALRAAAAAHAAPAHVPGGSAANVLKGLAGVSGGALRCQLVGMIGADAAGVQYTQQLKAHGVEAALLTSASGAPSAHCLCLVTPDGQRTMRTCLGAAAELTACDQLPAGVWSSPSLLHCEGYVLYKPQLARGAMAAAKRAGALVSLDCASFEVVRTCRETLLDLLAAGLVDVVFANEEEAAALVEGEAAAAAAGPGGGDARMARVEAAQTLVLRHARCCVVSLGSRGAVARSREGSVGSAPASKVAVVDTIGAGDLFSAGFLYAYLRGCSLSTACAAGCASGAEAVQTRGAALSQAAWARLRAAVADLVTPAGGAADDAAPPRDASRVMPCKRHHAAAAAAALAAGSYSSLSSSASAQWLFEPAEAAP